SCLSFCAAPPASSHDNFGRVRINFGGDPCITHCAWPSHRSRSSLPCVRRVVARPSRASTLVFFSSSGGRSSTRPIFGSHDPGICRGELDLCYLRCLL